MPAARHAAAACAVFERTTRRYQKPEFGIQSTVIAGATVVVHEETVIDMPFCRLLHFRRDIPDEAAKASPRVLLVSPMSGHFATLLRGTVETLLPDHDVYITDWRDAREISIGAGRFDLDDYIDYMRDLLAYFAGDVHVFAVCQSAVPVLAAVALMEEDHDPAVPASMILAGGPIDTRINPTKVNRFAERHGAAWFANNAVTTVPWPSPGFGRAVYPGFLQLSGFMSMNLDRHVNAHQDLFHDLVRGDGDSVEKHRDFYDEYLAVMDLTAEFYLQTIDSVFVRNELATAQMMHRGRRVDPTKIRRVALMTVEGEKDDITGVGQCLAAHALCSHVPDNGRAHFECPDVGHYGVFNGSRFRAEIAPRAATFMRAHDRRAGRFALMTDVESEAAAARAAGHGHELSSLAFTFAAANDTGRDRHAARIKAECTDSPPAGGSEAQSAAFRMFSFAGRLLIDGMFRMHEPPR